MKNQTVRAGAAVVVAAGLTLGTAVPAQAASWFGPGYTYPSSTEWKVPVCDGQGGFDAFFSRNLDGHYSDLDNFKATVTGVYSETFSSPSGMLRSLLYTTTQPINIVTYPTIDLFGHAAVTLTSRC